MTDPILIVGVPRSGTTLMRSVLSAHRNITIAPETHFLDVFAPSAMGETMNEASFRRFWAKFVAASQFREFDMDPDIISAAVIESANYDLRNVFRITLSEYGRKMGKPRSGEKTPEHYRHLHRLLEWFPSSRVVYMLRDPRAVCSSLMTVPWRGQALAGPRRLEPAKVRRSRRVYHDAVVWRDAYRNYDANWRHDPRVKLVRYEDLVQRPEEVAGALCDFLGEPLDPQMVASRSWSAVPPPPGKNVGGLLGWRYRHVRQTLGEITTSSVSKWKGELTDWEVSLIECVCGETMRAFQYDLEHESKAGSLTSQIGVWALAGIWAVRRQIAANP